MVYASTMDAQHDFERALSLRERLDKDYYLSDVEIVNVSKNGASWNILINNTGKNVLNPHLLTILINGAPVKITYINVNATGFWVDTNVWAPGEITNATVDFSGPIKRVKVVTQYGNFDYKVV